MGADLTEAPIVRSWPRAVFSRSHVALPVPLSTLVYGASDPASPARLPLATLSLRGESGVLTLSPALLMRTRFNPFCEGTENRSAALIADRSKR